MARDWSMPWQKSGLGELERPPTVERGLSSHLRLDPQRRSYKISPLTRSCKGDGDLGSRARTRADSTSGLEPLSSSPLSSSYTTCSSPADPYSSSSSCSRRCKSTSTLILERLLGMANHLVSLCTLSRVCSSPFATLRPSLL